MYYYEDEGQIFGEYNPAIWKQAYGTVVMIARDGGIYQIEDASARTHDEALLFLVHITD